MGGRRSANDEVDGSNKINVLYLDRLHAIPIPHIPPPLVRFDFIRTIDAHLLPGLHHHSALGARGFVDKNRRLYISPLNMSGSDETMRPRWATARVAAINGIQTETRRATAAASEARSRRSARHARYLKARVPRRHLIIELSRRDSWCRPLTAVCSGYTVSRNTFADAEENGLFIKSSRRNHCWWRVG